MLRIVRCAAVRADVPAVDDFLGRQVHRLQGLAGNVDGWVARSFDEDAARYVLVTAWEGFEAMATATGADIEHARLLDPLGGQIRDVRIEHLERMDLSPQGSGGEPHFLRLLAGAVPHRDAEAIYAVTRERTWTEIGRADGLVRAHVGRRSERDLDHIAFVTTWESREHLLRAYPGADTQPLAYQDPNVFAGLDIEHYEIVPPRPAGD